MYFSLLQSVKLIEIYKKLSGSDLLHVSLFKYQHFLIFTYVCLNCAYILRTIITLNCKIVQLIKIYKKVIKVKFVSYHKYSFDSLILWNHWVDATAGGPEVPEGNHQPSCQTWLPVLNFLGTSASFRILLDLYLPNVSDLMLLIRGYSLKHVYSIMKFTVIMATALIALYSDWSFSCKTYFSLNTEISWFRIIFLL